MRHAKLSSVVVIRRLVGKARAGRAGRAPRHLLVAGLCAALVFEGCAGGQMDSGGLLLQSPAPVPQAAPPLPPLAPPAPPPQYIYPSRGQSPQQEQFDKGECYTWAVQQSGFDPANPQVASPVPPPTPGAPEGGLFRGAAGGAALGAVGGAIGGSAGEGAAIGAAVGGLFGAMRRARYAEEQQQQQATFNAQRQNSLAQGRANYNRAFAVCMTGRGYTVNL